MIRSLFSAAAIELTAQLLKNSPFKIMGFIICKAYKPPPPLPKNPQKVYWHGISSTHFQKVLFEY